MLSISMANNVISYTKKQQKRSKNQKSWFYYVNLAPELRNDENLPKNGSLNRNLLNFFIGMVYFEYLRVNPHIQAIQNMCSKGG